MDATRLGASCIAWRNSLSAAPCSPRWAKTTPSVLCALSYVGLCASARRARLSASASCAGLGAGRLTIRVRVSPDAQLLPALHRERADHESGDPETRREHRSAYSPGPGGRQDPGDRPTRHEREAEARKVAVAVVRELEAGMHRAADRQDQQGGIEPGRQSRRPPSSEEHEQGGDHDEAQGRSEEGFGQGIDASRQLVHGR